MGTPAYFLVVMGYILAASCKLKVKARLIRSQIAARNRALGEANDWYR